VAANGAGQRRQSLRLTRRRALKGGRDRGEELKEQSDVKVPNCSGSASAENPECFVKISRTLKGSSDI